MNHKEIADLDRYLTEPPEYSTDTEIEEESTDLHKDDLGEIANEFII